MSWNPEYPMLGGLYRTTYPTQSVLGSNPLWDSSAWPSKDKFSFFDKGNDQFGWNANTLNFGLQGLNTIGNIWGAWQANKLAKDQLNFTKNFANRNLANQTQSYNTALEDRARARAAVEGQTSAEAQAYIDKNRLKG